MFARMCLLLALTALPGCTNIVISRHPISKPEDARFEQEFAGAWRVEDAPANTEYYFHIGQFGGEDVPECVTRVLWVVHETKDGKTGVGFAEFLGHVTRIGEKRFLSIVMPWKLGPEEGIRAKWEPKEFRAYRLYRVKLSGEELVVHTMELEPAARLVNEGKLAGDVEKSTEGKVMKVELSATPEQLRTFLATPESDALFSGKPMRLKRVK
jgi:hypothetical protein